MKYCHKCHTEWDGVNQPPAGETCDKCFADLHVCLNCRFYDESKPLQCRVESVDPVTDKMKANYCEEFQFADKPLPPGDAGNTGKAKEQWNKLFKRTQR